MKHIILLPILFLAPIFCVHAENSGPIDPSCRSRLPDNEDDRVRVLESDKRLLQMLSDNNIKPDGRMSLLLAGGCAPRGQDLTWILLENQSVPLKGTGCQSGADDRRRLQHQLALLLGGGFGSPHQQAELLDKCDIDRQKVSSGTMIDVWNCSLTVREKNEKGEVIASRSLGFVFAKDTWKLIPEKLTCTP